MSVKLPKLWLDRIADYLKANGKRRRHLLAGDFPLDGSVILTHDDGTTCVFRHAIALEYDDGILVLTEHTGYHLFQPACFSVFTAN